MLAPDSTVTSATAGSDRRVLLDTGVAQSGTWQVQVSNTNTTAGTLGSLSFRRLAIDGTIDLGGSANFTGTETLVSRHYLIRPGAATSVAYKLSVRSPLLGVTVSPMGATIDKTQTTGRVLAHSPLLLPIVAVQEQGRRSTTLSATTPRSCRSTPTSPPLRLPAATSASADRRRGASAQWSMGLASTLSGFQLTLYGPDGAKLIGSGATHRIFTRRRAAATRSSCEPSRAAAAPR